MADLTPEVQVRAVIKEAAVPPPIQPLVDSLRRSLDTKSAEAALRLAANRDVDQAKINFAINENIGTERRANGTKNITAGSPEAARRTRADSIGALLGTYTERGFDRLTLTQQADAMNSVINLVDSYPAFHSVLIGPPAMNPAERRQFAQRLLKDPAFKEQVVNGLRDAVDVAGVDTDSIARLQKEFNEANAEVIRLGGEIVASNTKINTSRARLREFEPEVIDPTRVPTPPHLREGDTFHAINTLNGEVAAANTAIRTRTIDLTRVRGELAGHKDRLRMATRSQGGLTPGDIPAINGDITTADTAITTMTLDIETFNREVAEKTAKKDALVGQENTFKQQIADEQTKITQFETQRAEKDKLRTEKQEELSKTRANQTLNEEQFVTKLEGVLAEATAKHINSQIEVTTEEGKKTLEKQATESKDARSKAVLTNIKNRYFGGGSINREQINGDFGELMRNGPDNIIRYGLASGGLTPAEVTAAMNDASFVKDMREKVGEQVMGFHLLRGGWLGRNGRISADESLMIANSDWGESIVNTALQKKKNWQDVLKAQMGEGIINSNGTLSERFRNMDFAKLTKILLLLFGGTAAALILGPAALGAAGGAIGAVIPK